MSDVCRIGIKYMAEKADKQQQQLDHALVMNIRADQKAGMQGQPLPYQLRSDVFVTGIILVCFILFSYALKNGKKYVIQRIKELFQYKERISLFDEASASSNRYAFTLTFITAILSGMYIYEYVSETNLPLIHLATHELLLGIYIGATLLYIAFKGAAYEFINWIFFDKERNKYWIQTYFNLVSGVSFLLFPVVLLIIYFNLGIQIGKILIIFLLFFAKILLFYKSIRNFFKHVYGFMHFILYFCALEIIPLILFWKGITYINNILVLKF